MAWLFAHGGRDHFEYATETVIAAQKLAETLHSPILDAEHLLAALVEPDDGVYDRIDAYWIDFEMILVPQVRKWKWRMWADHGMEFFIHPAMQARPGLGFPEFFRQDRDGQPRG